MYNVVAQRATENLHRQRADYLYIGPMESVAAHLKALRTSVTPAPTIREVAEALGYGDNHNKYAYYEDAKRFKREALPLHLARSLAEVFEPYGIDREDVLRLAGLEPDQPVGDYAPGRVDPKWLERLNLAEIADASHGYAMGAGSFVDSGAVAFRYFDRDWLRGVTGVAADQLVFVRGVGDSMLPTIHEDDAILVDTGDFIINRQDKIWAFTYGGLGMIKRVRSIPADGPQPRYLIISDNQTVDNFEVSASEITVRGRVVWVGRKV